MKSTHGGKRKGAGKPKGVKWPTTLDKFAAREAVRTMVTAKLKPLVDAQIQNALGLSHLYMRDEQGKFVKITDPDQIEVILNSGEQDKYFYIQTKDPSIQAFTDLMNRALDKAKEQEQEIKVSGDADLIAALHRGRDRAAKARKAESDD